MSYSKKMRKMAQDAVSKAADAMSKANLALSEAHAALQMMDEMSDEDLDKVSGGFDPFAAVDRVPDSEIDDELRKKG